MASRFTRHTLGRWQHVIPAYYGDLERYMILYAVVLMTENGHSLNIESSWGANVGGAGRCASDWAAC